MNYDDIKIILAATTIQKYVRKYLISKRMETVNKKYRTILMDFNMNQLKYNDILMLPVWRKDQQNIQDMDYLSNEFNGIYIETLWLQQAIISRKSFLYFKNQI